MKIALIGFGKMGREIDAVAREQGETIAHVFEIDSPVRAPGPGGRRCLYRFFDSRLRALEHPLRREARRDIVVGTTGWDKHLPEIRNMVKESGLLYSSNFSLGMNIFFRIAASAAELMRKSSEYDPYIEEIHHRQKADSPSGTALSLGRILLQRIDRKKDILSNPPEGKIPPEKLHIASIRAGSVTGIHTVGFDSEADLIELRHTAKNRRGFALGALTAARWLRGRKGVYTMDDVEL